MCRLTLGQFSQLSPLECGISSCVFGFINQTSRQENTHSCTLYSFSSAYVSVCVFKLDRPEAYHQPSLVCCGCNETDECYVTDGPGRVLISQTQWVEGVIIVTGGAKRGLTAGG